MIVEPRSDRSGRRKPAEVKPLKADSSCVDAARLRDTIQDEEILRGAMRRHVERCTACREAVLLQEPTTLFRRLPKVELTADEIAEMRQRVKGVRRARRVAGASDAAGSHRSAWVAAAATLCLLGGLAVFQLGLENVPAEPMRSQGAALASAPGFGSPGVGAPGRNALSAEDEARLDRALAAQALIESDDVLSEQVVLMQVASRASDLAWVANGRLDL